MPREEARAAFPDSEKRTSATPSGEPPAPAPTDRLETEWQFDAPDLASLDNWLSENTRAGSFLVPQERVQGIRDEYMDTADFRIFRAGYALRIRKRGNEAEASLKELAPREGDLAIRREITQPLRAGGEHALFESDGPVTKRLRLLCGEGDVRAIALIWTERQVFEIARDAIPAAAPAGAPGAEDASAAGARGSFGAEVVLDRSFTNDSLGRAHRLSRLEIEVPQEEVPVFRALAERMRVECRLEGARQSKFEWALEANAVRADTTMSLGRVEVTREMSVGQVADAVLRKHLAAFLWHEPGTRLGDDPEHLHDMRVAARRMRAALRLFGDAYPEGEADRLRSGLGEVGRCLGEVRDLDVLMEQVDELGAKLLTVPPAAVVPIRDGLAREREAARVRMIEALDSPSFTALKEDLVRFVRGGPPAASSQAASPILGFGPRVIRSAHRAFMRLARRIDLESPPAEYHKLRIRGKRLRYVLEFLGDIYSAPAREQVGILVEVQDLLGLHQDAQVSIEKLRSIAAEKSAGFAPETWAALGELAQAYRARAERLRREFPALRRRVKGEKWRALKRLAKRPPSAPKGPSGIPSLEKPAQGEPL